MDSGIRGPTDATPHAGVATPPLDHTVDQSPADLDHAQLLSRHAGPPAQVPGYDIERCLGAGAFGTVWLAMQKSTSKRVAIKFYAHRGGLDWALLNREVEKLAVLYTDRDIVQLIDVGWNATPPYYVMEYLERGSLEQRLRDGSMSVDEAVRIVLEVTQALVHAHGRGILHCDLKPANVLLDNDWKVRLADFGQSRLSYEQLPALGTLFYMAPEQADLAASPDARWDVYALGALLFNLLTGDPPFRSDELESKLRAAPNLSTRLDEYRRSLVAAPRPAGHRRERGVDRALADIVDRCLEIEPARRFANAQAVFDALDARTRQRARRPMLALGFAAPLVLLAATVGFGVAGWRDAVAQSESSLVRAVQAGNVYAAKGVASTVLLRLQRLARAVQRVAEDSELHDLLARPDQARLQQFIEETQEFFDDPDNGLAQSGGDPPFDSWFVMNRDGTQLARSPASNLVGTNYAWRDYFAGALRQLADEHPDPVYVSRVFRSELDTKYKFCISGLVRIGDEGPHRGFVGIVAATLTTGSLPLHDDQRTAVLVGRWDSNRRPDSPPPTLPPPRDLILLHPAYNRGDQAEELHSRVLDSISQARDAGDSLDPNDVMDQNYEDPLQARAPEYAGRWLAGFAPVGPTEFVVIVQQRYDEATQPVKSLASNLARRGWIALMVGVALLAGIWYLVQRAMMDRSRIATHAAPSGISTSGPRDGPTAVAPGNSPQRE